MSNWIKAYKGFNKDLQCTPSGKTFQYEIGKKYAEDDAVICKKGFHAVLDPYDVFKYYKPTDSRYCEVELDDSGQTHDDSKRVGSHIKIGAEIGLKGLLSAAFKLVIDKVDWKNAEAAYSGDRGTAAYSGDRGTAAYSGDEGTAELDGQDCVALTVGQKCKAKGKIGCLLIFVERDDDGKIIAHKSVMVEGKRYKEDVFYTLKGGKVVEAE